MNWIKAKAKRAWQRVRQWWVAGLVALGLVAAPILALSQANLSWTLPTTYNNGDTLDPADIDNVVVYVQQFPLSGPPDSNRSYTEVARLPGDAVGYTHTRTETGLYCYVVTVVVGGTESAYSSESCKVHDLRVPNPPTNFEVN